MRPPSVVYTEVAPNGRQGRHTESTKEAASVLAAEDKAKIDGEWELRGAGGPLPIPAIAPLDPDNVDTGPVRVVGYFVGAALVHHFSEPFLTRAEEVIFLEGPGGVALIPPASWRNLPVLRD